MVAVMYTTWIHTQSKRMKGEKKKKRITPFCPLPLNHWTLFKKTNITPPHFLSNSKDVKVASNINTTVYTSCFTTFLQTVSETQLHTHLAQNDSSSHGMFFLDLERTVVVWWSEPVPSLRTWHLSTGWNRVWRPPRPGTGSSPSEAGPGRGYPGSHEDVAHPACRRTHRKTYIS